MSLSPALLAKRIAAITAVIEGKPGAESSTLPGAKGVTLYKVKGKMFAILNVHHVRSVTVKCDPHLVDVMKAKYAGIGTAVTSTAASGSMRAWTRMCR